ncbi:MAG: tRNA (uridine(34)/cytosine(34)/5-carboxymethylaminomethyluridine(34)-2'-O)-methyltransferase TrmL [Pseudomonadota bacterium]|nr:tRNA (uridine(34)/cytosine(34)/5-carboxymethylaminomethyluridine(34)-2'-O)-methyltransferase TrmL [Pseudomonadota bacterium]MEC9077312.1 tRNA (uridine(34)/cytosine(34)/5-carboxymethylaminomethyluridine(34)-2'-O)-methyltransferase TrmL [Pseudomonadota bacterium]
MLTVCLYQPEIPPNTGNIIRLCANTGSQLHLIRPLGFSLDEKSVRRSGLDYHDLARVKEFESWDHYIGGPQRRIFALSTKGVASYESIAYQSEDVLLFGPETRGLPENVRKHSSVTEIIRIPMCPNNRSLNLSNSVAIVLYEAWRQLGFQGSVA